MTVSRSSAISTTPVPHFDMGELADMPTDADREAVRAYFAQFADTRNDEMEVTCPGCDRKLYGHRGAIWQAVGIYTFEWGLAHGEGRCGDCGWPAKGHPEVTISDGRVMRFPLPLPYHPDNVESGS